MLGTESGSAECKAGTLPTVLSLWLRKENVKEKIHSFFSFWASGLGLQPALIGAYSWFCAHASLLGEHTGYQE